MLRGAYRPSNASPSQAASRAAISSPVTTCGSGSLAAGARIDAIGEVGSSLSATSQPRKRDRAWWRARMVVGRMPRSYSETVKDLEMLWRKFCHDRRQPARHEERLELDDSGAVRPPRRRHPAVGRQVADERTPQVEQVAVAGAEVGAGRWVRHRTAPIVDSSSAVLTELPQISTVGILGGCSFDRLLVDLSTIRVAE